MPVIRYNEFSSGLCLTVLITTWRCRLVGRGRTTGNRVTVKSGSRVRISPSPPKKTRRNAGFSFVYAGFQAFYALRLLLIFLRISAFQWHRKTQENIVKSPPRWRGDSLPYPVGDTKCFVQKVFLLCGRIGYGLVDGFFLFAAGRVGHRLTVLALVAYDTTGCKSMPHSTGHR